MTRCGSPFDRGDPGDAWTSCEDGGTRQPSSQAERSDQLDYGIRLKASTYSPAAFTVSTSDPRTFS
jgi:hypothetical protein